MGREPFDRPRSGCNQGDTAVRGAGENKYTLNLNLFPFCAKCQDVFEAEDLLELRNIPKVTKCLAQLSKLVRKHGISQRK